MALVPVTSEVASSSLVVPAIFNQGLKSNLGSLIFFAADASGVRCNRNGAFEARQQELRLTQKMAGAF